MSAQLSTFLDQVRRRSSENKKAFHLLYEAGLYGVAIGLFRQELDTLIRLSYLWCPETSIDAANSLMEKSALGLRWTVVNHNGEEIRLTDRGMLDLASNLGGWEQVVYSFGCKLIHLSEYHLYQDVDPFDAMSEQEQREIIDYLSRYHDYPLAEIGFNHLVPYLPKIMDKILSNVEFYAEELLQKMRCYENP